MYIYIYIYIYIYTLSTQHNYQIHFKILKWISQRVNLQTTFLKIEAQNQLIK